MKQKTIFEEIARISDKEKIPLSELVLSNIEEFSLWEFINCILLYSLANDILEVLK